MPIKINFDASHNPEQPTLVLSTRNGTKLGGINARNIILKDASTSEISFTVNKYVDGVEDELWDSIKNFKLVWCKEWDTWFEIYVEIDETDNTKKIVNGVNLGVAELSQAVLYGMQVNTEEDIAREDYAPTVLYDGFDENASLLHRILKEKAQHYKVIHVDKTIAKIQRTFTFDGVSVYDAFLQIADEIGCIFVLHSNSDELGNIQRTISVYDTHSICNSCGYRGDFIDVCPECASTDVTNTYGEDTTIFITADDLTDDIQFTSDTGSIKNCFKLEAGDDLMTATVRNCNPNGSDYIWRFSEETREDMDPELVKKIDEYDNMYKYYQKEYEVPLSDELVDQYNALVDKYSKYNPDLEKIEKPVIGYPGLMDVYYDVIDLTGYLQTSLMPNIEMDEVTAEQQVGLLTQTNMDPIAVSNMDIVSEATATNAVLNMAKCIVDNRYQITANDTALNVKQWSGTLTVTNYTYKEDTATSKMLYLQITDDFREYVEQKVYKALAKTNDENYSITGLFEKDLDAFKEELKKYSFDSLKRFLNCCQGCLDVMIEAGVADEAAWTSAPQNLYSELYTPYFEKHKAIEAEMTVRQSELDILEGVYDSNGGLIKKGLQTEIEELKGQIQDKLNFQTYLGDELWLQFCAYRRDDKYVNSNFISDGLTNAEIFSRAMDFIKLANEELYRSSELQHSVTVSSLKNFLLIDRFKGFAEHFERGNWMRVRIDDTVYKLRLLEYEIDYDNIENISVTFSDVIKTSDGLSAVQTAVAQVQSMASSYDSVQRQAVDGATGNKYIKTWFEDGLDVTNMYIVNNSDGQVQTWDEHGMLFRAYDPVTEMYDEVQMKIINSTLVVTDDDWEHVKTAIGFFYYVDPVDGKTKSAFGVNAEMVIGKMILGQSLGLYTDSNSLTFNQDGLQITNGVNTFTVNPNDEKLLRVSNGTEDVLWVDEHGGLHIRGDGAGLDIQANDYIKNMYTHIEQNSEAIKLEAYRANEVEGELKASIKVTADAIESEVSRAQGAEGTLSSKITQTADSIRSEVQKADGALKTQIEQTAESIRAEVADTAAGLQSSLELTAESIRSEVENTKAGLESSITETAEEIRAEVKSTKEGLQSSLTETAEDIRAEVADTKKGLQASIDVNSEAIAAEVKRAGEAEAALRVTADGITQSVTDLEKNVTTTIETTAGELKAAFEDADNELSSRITANTEKIEAEVKRAGEAEAKLQITADSITQSVSDLETGMNSKIEQTADGIKQTVDGKLEKYSTTEQMNESITQSVNEGMDTVTAETDEKLKEYSTTKQVSSMIEQTADKITLQVNTTLESYSTVEGVTASVTKALGDANEYTNKQLLNYSTTTEVTEQITAAIEVSEQNIKLAVNTELEGYSTTEATAQAVQGAKDYTNNQLTNYYTKTTTEEKISSAIEVSKEQITLSVNDTLKSYSTTDVMNGAINSGVNAANAATDEKLKNYTITTEMNTTIDNKINASKEGIILSAVTQVNATHYTKDAVDNLLDSYVTTATYSAQIQVMNNNITSKVSKTELGTEVSSQIEQKADSIRLKAAHIVWEADKSSMDEEGNFECTSGNFNGSIDATKITALQEYKIYHSKVEDELIIIRAGTSKWTTGNYDIRMGILPINDSKTKAAHSYIDFSVNSDSGEIHLTSSEIYIGAEGAATLYVGDVYADKICLGSEDIYNIFARKGEGGSVDLSGYAKVGHTHSYNEVSGVARSNHSHSYSEVGAAAADHTHTQYASASSLSSLATRVSALENAGSSGGSSSSGGNATYAEKAHSVCTAAAGGYLVVANGTSNGFIPNGNNSYQLGGSSNYWTTAYLKNGVSTSSDKRLKENIRGFNEAYERVFMDLKPSIYKFKNVKETDNHDRVHFGFIAQEVEQTMLDNGLDDTDCAMICKDSVTEDGENVYEEYGINDYIYSFRYEEVIPLNTHMIQKSLHHQEEQDNLIAQQEAQIEQLTQMNLMLLDRLTKLEKQMEA